MGTLIKTDGVSIAEREGQILSRFISSNGELRGADLKRACSVPKGSIYVILKRMEQKNLIQSRVGENPSHIIGPAPRYWSLTAFGQNVATKILTL